MLIWKYKIQSCVLTLIASFSEKKIFLQNTRIYKSLNWNNIYFFFTKWQLTSTTVGQI